jgi:hypothetical protein
MVTLMILTSIAHDQTLSETFTLTIDDVSEEVVDWVKQCDDKGDGVYVLKLSREKAEQLLFANDSEKVQEEKREVPKDIYCVYIYVNNFKLDGIGQKPLGEVTANNKTLEITYNTTYLSNDKLPNYELSEISAIGYKINKLTILVNGEEVQYSLSELE